MKPFIKKQKNNKIPTNKTKLWSSKIYTVSDPWTAKATWLIGKACNIAFPGFNTSKLNDNEKEQSGSEIFWKQFVAKQSSEN